MNNTDIERQRDELYEEVRAEIERLKSSYLGEIKNYEYHLKEMLKDTLDVTCRQIIKEGINDCLALLKNNPEVYHYQEKIYTHPSFPCIYDPSRNIYAKADVLQSYQGKPIIVDGYNTIMFFGNGDIFILGE